MSLKLAFIAQGRLFYLDGENAELIESAYGQDVIKRGMEREAKRQWKGGGADSSMLYNRATLWGQSTLADGKAVRVKVTAVAPGKTDRELTYVVATDQVGGLFNYEMNTKKETRVFHKESLLLTDFARYPDEDIIACSQRFANGTQSIAIVRGNDVLQVTEGDSVDEAPAWIPGRGKRMVYQCSGIARNRAGLMVGLGPASLQELNVETGELKTLYEDEKSDFLAPRMDGTGNVFYIRRPFEATYKTDYPLKKMLMDVVLFPFRLVRAFVHFLNVFSMVFSQKPLMTAGGPKVEGPEEKFLFLRGRIIDAQEAMKKQTEDAPSLVPKTWQLCTRKGNGEEKVLAHGVICYDLVGDGSVVYSTGVGVFQIAADGSNRKKLSKENVVETIVVLSGAATESPSADADSQATSEAVAAETPAG